MSTLIVETIQGVPIRDMSFETLLGLDETELTNAQLLEVAKVLQAQRQSAPTRRASEKKASRILSVVPKKAILDIADM